MFILGEKYSFLGGDFCCCLGGNCCCLGLGGDALFGESWRDRDWRIVVWAVLRREQLAVLIFLLRPKNYWVGFLDNWHDSVLLNILIV